MHLHGALQALLRPLAAVMSEFVMAFNQKEKSQWSLGMQLLGALDVYIFDT